MTSVRYDVRDALRALVRSPGYTAAVIVTLGMGIGLNTAIFTVVDAVLLKPLPYPEAERLVRVAEWPHTGGNVTMAPAAFLAWRPQVRSFSHFEARVPAGLALQHDDAVEEVRGFGVTPGYFDMLGISADRGRTFVPADAVDGAPCVVVVSHRFLSARLGATGAPVEHVRLNGRSCEIVGVLPADTVFDRASVDVYLPLALGPAFATNQGRFLTVLGRLRPGVELQTAGAEMETLAAAFNASRGPAGQGWTTRTTPLRDVVIRADVRWLARMLFGAVAAVLAVACLNVAGLSLSRTIARRREISIRAALGASRARLVRYLLVESVLLAFAGGAFGLIVGSWALRVFLALAPAGTLPAEAAVALDGRALMFTAAVAIATGVLFGLAPAARATSTPAGEALTRSRMAGPTRATAAIHRGLLVAEVACAVVLVIGATALTTSFIRLTRVNPGFASDQVLTMRIALPRDRYATGEAAARFFDAALAAFRRVPGVEHAAAVTSLPLGGWLYGTTFTIQGAPSQPELPPSAHIQHVSEEYSEALRLSLAGGRWFTVDDTAGSPRVAVVNETLVRRYLPDGIAVGRQLRLGITAGQDGAPLWEVVGVVRDVKTGSLADAALATPEIYVPHRQSPQWSMFVVVRGGAGDPARLAPALRAVVRGLDAELPIGALATMDERLGTSVRRERFRTTLVGSSAVLALLLSCLGVYAIRSQAIAARIREMGVRLAVGATPGQLLSMALRQGMWQVLIGIVAGLVLFGWVARFLEPWLFATDTTEPRVLAAASALFAAAALAASWLPARRAARVDPLVLLRDE